MSTDPGGGRPWSRESAAIAPGREVLTRFVASAFPGAVLDGWTALGGGRANTNLRLDLDCAPHRVVLRLYQRDPLQRAKEAALLDRLAGTVPVPRVLGSGEDATGLGAPWLLLGFVEGVALERIFGRLDREARHAAGRAAGHVLAAIHANRMPCAGFLDGRLAVVAPLPEGPGSTGRVLDLLLDSGAARARLGDPRCAAMTHHLARHAPAIAAWPGDARLVHADFGASNILMSGDGAAVAAVLDWEFALAASPLLDLGNLIRPAQGDADDFVAGVAEGYREVDPSLPGDWAGLARAVDLLAWAEFAGRESPPADLVAHACHMVDRIVAGAP